MKKYTKQFLLSSFVLGYLFFGFIIYSNIAFLDSLTSPVHLLFLILGFLSPFIGSLITFSLNKDSLGGFKGLVEKYKKIKVGSALVLVLVFTLIHYGLAILLNNVEFFQGANQYIVYIPIVIFLFTSQEVGWRLLVQSSFEEDKGYLKSIIITGLFWSLWFLPLIFIKGFIILPQFYTQFAILLVGINFLLTSLYSISGSILYSGLLAGLILSLAPIILVKQNFKILPIAIIEAIIGIYFKNKASR